MKDTLKMIAFLAASFIALIGVGNGIGYMIQAGAPFINILGLVIAAVPACLLVYKVLKEEVTAVKRPDGK